LGETGDQPNRARGAEYRRVVSIDLIAEPGITFLVQRRCLLQGIFGTVRHAQLMEGDGQQRLVIGTANGLTLADD
jgi:hypothetical protein